MLKNLREFTSEVRALLSEEIPKVKEIKFTESFKAGFREVSEARVEFHESFAKFQTAKGQYILAPSVWFYVSALLAPLLRELIQYKKQAESIFEEAGLSEHDAFQDWTGKTLDK